LPGVALISRIRWAFWLPVLAFSLYGLLVVHYSAPARRLGFVGLPE